MKIKDLYTKALHIFDIDDTLFYAVARIKVMKDGKEIKSLSNSEFNNYRLNQGEVFDFSEFRSSDVFTKGIPVRTTIRTLQELQKDSNNTIVFITARADLDDKNKFLKKFKEYGINIEKIHVHRAGNIMGNELPGIKKVYYIEKELAKDNFAEAHMYEDSKANLQHFMQLQAKYPDIKFTEHYIK